MLALMCRCLSADTSSFPSEIMWPMLAEAMVRAALIFNVARKPLPLPGDLQYIWLNVMKIIDELHIKNHVDPRCQQYHSDIVRETIPDMNTMACEQKFKKNSKCNAENSPPFLSGAETQ